MIHLWLAWALLRRPAYLRPLALGVAAVEIAIILTKFFVFLSAPEWTIWTTNWFINKLFVLACFLLMLPYFALQRPRARTAAGRGRLPRGLTPRRLLPLNSGREARAADARPGPSQGGEKAWPRK